MNLRPRAPHHIPEPVSHASGLFIAALCFLIAGFTGVSAASLILWGPPGLLLTAGVCALVIGAVVLCISYNEP